MGGKFIVLLVIFAVAVQRASALNCYQCTTFNTTGLNIPLDPQYTMKADCANSPPPDTYKGKSSCQDATLYNAKCVKAAGNVKGKTTAGVDVDIKDGTLRSCYQIPITYENKCYEGADSVALVLMMFPDLIPGQSEITVKLCMCDGDNCNSGSAVRPLAALLALAFVAKLLVM
ncbi:uncharacterized protein LOC119736599 [Patiria miniata]|uniref:Protein sleepless n=1 Tax=Patiria miniata TaxID=46514 RepID=A0A914ARZ5_PATMI|nr:uncharacterized protein LOC119736599 [Patiria miniata]